MGGASSTPKKITAAIGVFLDFLVAPLFPGFAIRRLVGALESPVEDASMAAYMALSKVGAKRSGAVLDEIKKQGPTPGRMQLLGDLGDPLVIPDLEAFAATGDPATAAMARESIALLKGDASEEG